MRSRVTAVVTTALLVTALLAGAHLLRAAGPWPDPGRFLHVATEPTPGTTPQGSPPPVTEPTRAADPERLRPGERPPQFVVVSFDGVGWHEMWQHWLAIGRQVPFRFTGFLSGTYLLSDRTRSAYHPPYYPAGTSEILWGSAADLPVEIRDLNAALAAGNEIGTHFNGHFCAGAGLPSGGNTWDTEDWGVELDQFFSLLADVRSNNPGERLPRLHVRPGDIIGERTPCLEGLPSALFPALRRHGIVYDSTFTREGLSWPTRSADGIWQLGMQAFPVHGTLPDGRTGVPVTSMDYNYWFTQRGASSAGLTAADSARDEQQVLATYRDMYTAALHGNRAPLILGNHFNDWNRGAYRDALSTFVLETCGQPQTRCVTFRDLVTWLEAQSPRVLRHLQALPPETAPPG
ncbi:MAG TPA: hypothetical protein VFT00_04575 [Nocardioides sp.]|nr:hypothetical protein [Nocardioides sp.]